jgi:hypothetical protein
MSSGVKPIMVTVSRPVTLRQTRAAYSVYDPNLDRRRCDHCGQRDGWTRIEHGPIVGGWFCQCSPLPEITAVPETMRHTCTVACALAGVA